MQSTRSRFSVLSRRPHSYTPVLSSTAHSICATHHFPRRRHLASPVAPHLHRQQAVYKNHNHDRYFWHSFITSRHLNTMTTSATPQDAIKVATGDDLAKQLEGLIDFDVEQLNEASSSAATTSTTIDNLFQKTLAADSNGAEDFLYTLWNVVVKSAVATPATDPRLQHLVDVMAALKKKETAEVEIWDSKVTVWKDLPMLGPALRDAWNFKPEFDGSETHAAIQRWISLNSFAARILGNKLQDSFNFAVWELRDGLEEKHPSEASRDLHLSTASEWLLHAGQELHRLSSAAAGGLNDWEVSVTSTGSLVPTPSKGPSLTRWAFWKTRLGELSQEMSHEAKEEGLKERVDGVVTNMDLIEKGSK